MIGMTGRSSWINFESRREQVRLQEELYMKEKVPRNTQIRSLHEMGETDREQERRIDEVSVQKLREDHETIQQLISQLQQMQQQMKSLSDSEISKMWNHIKVEDSLTFPVSSRSLLSHDKRLPLDAWNQSG